MISASVRFTDNPVTRIIKKSSFKDYDPDQERDPEGTTTGGQFSAGAATQNVKQAQGRSPGRTGEQVDKQTKVMAVARANVKSVSSGSRKADSRKAGYKEAKARLEMAAGSGDVTERRVSERQLVWLNALEQVGMPFEDVESFKDMVNRKGDNQLTFHAFNSKGPEQLSAIKKLIEEYGPKWLKKSARQKKAASDDGDFTPENVEEIIARQTTPITSGAYERGEIHSIGYYSTMGYSDVNQTLRGQAGASEDTDRHVARIDSAMSKSALLKDTTVYRGVRADTYQQLFNMRKGGVFADPAYMSTSTDESQAITFSEGKLIRLKLPKGTKAMDIVPYSDLPELQEILLPRGTSLRKIGNTRKYLDFELVEEENR